MRSYDLFLKIEDNQVEGILSKSEGQDSIQHFIDAWSKDKKTMLSGIINTAVSKIKDSVLVVYYSCHSVSDIEGLTLTYKKGVSVILRELTDLELLPKCLINDVIEYPEVVESIQ